MLQFVQNYAPQLVAAGLTLILGVIQWLFKPIVKLQWGLSHGFIHSLHPINREQEPPLPAISVHTTSYIMINQGKKTAHNVVSTFNYQPASIEIWPQRDFETSVNPNGKYIIKFDTLAPKEQFSINLITIDRHAPDLLNVRCDEACGQQINIWPVRQWPQAFLYFLTMLLAFGVFATIYLFILFISFLSNIA